MQQGESSASVQGQAQVVSVVQDQNNLNNTNISGNPEETSKDSNSDKVNHVVIKSPHAPVIRQRSLFTANPAPTSKFNVAASPFVSTQRAATPKENSPRISQIGAPVPHVPPIPHIGHSLPFDGRVLRSLSARHLAPPMYPYEDDICRIPAMPPAFPLPFSNRRSNREFDSTRSCGPMALPNGTIQIRLRDGIRVDMTLDKAVRVVNQRSRVAISLSSNGSSSALIHPNGRVYQYGSRVEIVAYDGMKTNNYVRYAKMWYKGVSFTSENCALTYLVDAAGTRTTSDSFTDMSKDYTIAVFYNDSRHGPAYAQEATAVLQDSKFQCSEDGTEVFEINGFRISQTADGLVKITRNHNKCLIRTSPGNGSATLTTPIIHCTASLGKTSHLFVRRGERRMHFDGASFVVRNAGHSAGFDENNLLNVY
ncbi:unnamed protein product [Hermetia illucens]|uniref:Uncharacterized protein n=1 Tax=Hermetia illucens TaxID=343691 RepID=A0A7R8UCG3_HERIL|nr:uncharacterized protein LOC119647291 isoform X2 [Hermetia illucens]CAD7078019.1 unnamed protein product [Hermetia illucens]